MTSFIAHRLLAAVPVLAAVSVITFLLMNLSAAGYVPGLNLAETLRPGDIDRLRTQLGLDRPLYVQYLSWAGGLLRGDFGNSMIDGSPVLSNIIDRLPNTLLLTGAALVVAIVLAVPIGVVSAVNRGRVLDHALGAVAVAGYALPSFWLGLMMIQVFSVTFQSLGLPWLPSAGSHSPVSGGDPLDRLRHLVMPVTVLAFIYLARWSRFVRSSMLTALTEDYVRTARAKGLQEIRVRYVHALRNALLPLVTLVGLAIPHLVSGALVVEIVFGWPGLGRFTFERATEYDYPAVMGIVMFTSVMVVIGNLLADLAYGLIDPRIRHTSTRP